MDARSFDEITRIFARCRLSRRRAIATAASATVAGISLVASSDAGAAQEIPATPVTAAEAKRPFLFVQSFRSGSITPEVGSDDSFTLALEDGTGHTIYFADRPGRDVGAVPTSAFLNGLGFPRDNPPNAALVIDTGNGDTDIAVVELFSPVVTDDGAGVTYDVKFLDNWEASLELGFSEAPTGIPQVATNFGVAHLFIDDCPDDYVTCLIPGEAVIGTIGPMGYCWHWEDFTCYPCEPAYHNPIPGGRGPWEYWKQKCNDIYAACNGKCLARFEGVW